MSRHRPVIAVVADPTDPSARPPAGLPTGLADLAGWADLRPVGHRDGLEDAIAGADVLVVYDIRTTVVADLGPRAGALGWIHAASAGVDAVLTPDVVEGPVVVTNAHGVFDDAIAEWVLAVLLLFGKDMVTTLALQRARTWRHRETERLAGRRLVVVGAGSIGGAVARLCAAAGLAVRGVARRARPAGDGFEAVVGVEHLHDELAAADDVVVAAPLTAGTRRLIDAAALAALRPGARLVNVGRGPVVDQDALLAALRRGQVGAAALDVFEDEPLPADHPFWAMDQVLVSPHMSGDVVGWRHELSAQFVANLERWRAGEPLVHVIDKRALAGAVR